MTPKLSPLFQAALAALTLNAAAALSASAQNWEETLAEASGQTLFFNAWGGDERITLTSPGPVIGFRKTSA